MPTYIEHAPNFTLEELYASATAKARGINNYPDLEARQNLVYLARKVLQPIRDHFGEPIIVTSGYRSPALNKAVNGSPTSFHSFGCAADIRFKRGYTNRKMREIFEFIYHSLPYTELIAEEIPDGWIHVAIMQGREQEKQLKYKLPGVSGVKRDKSYEQIISLFGDK